MSRRSGRPMGQWQPSLVNRIPDADLIGGQTVEAAFEPSPEEEQAEREAHRAAVLRQIRKLVEFHGISREELTAAPVPFETALPPDLPPKYRHPVSGDTWDGVGAQPDWLRKALLQEGYRVAELRVADGSAPSDTAGEAG